MGTLLVRMFVKGFYKKYAKGLFLSFCLFFSYCIFIQTAGEFLTETNDFWSMLISLKIATDPFFILLFWLFCSAYSFTCIRYLLAELKSEKYLFLQYTLNCLYFTQRFKLWAIVTMLIHLPVILFSIYSLCIGVYLSNMFYGVLSPMYLLLSVALIAIFIDRFRLYQIKNLSTSKFIIGKSRHLKYFMNFNNQIKNHFLMLFFFKILSLGIIYLFTHLIVAKETGQTIRFAVSLVLNISIAHTAIIYKDYLFEARNMIFCLNFPYNRLTRSLNLLPYYSLLIVPEFTYIAYIYDSYIALFWALSILVFFIQIRAFIFLIGNKPLFLVKILTTYYFISIIFILYGFHLVLLLIAVIIALIGTLKFYRYEAIGDNQDN